MDMKVLFSKFDKDKDGKISKKELKSALQKMFELSNDEVEGIGLVIDTTGDGNID